MDAGEIISKVLSIKSLKLKDQNDLAIKCGILPNTLTVAINRDKLSSDVVQKIHDKLHVSKEFLREGKGPIMDDDPTAVTEVPENIYRDLVESNSDYRLVPKTILDEEYRIVLKSQLEQEKRILDILLEAKDKLISQLESEINQLRGNVVLKTKKA